MRVCFSRTTYSLVCCTTILFSFVLFFFISNPALADNEPESCSWPEIDCVELETTEYQYCYKLNNGCIPFPSVDAYVQYYEDVDRFSPPTVVCSIAYTPVEGVAWTNQTAGGQSVTITTDIGATVSNYGFVVIETINHYHDVSITRPNNSQNSCSGATRTFLSESPLTRYRNTFCPDGTNITYGFEGDSSRIYSAKCSFPISPPPKLKACGVGNPCDPLTGFKYQPESDFVGPLALKRNYNSGYLKNVGYGRGWRSDYHKELSRYPGAKYLYIIEGSGRGEKWTEQNGVWNGDADSDYVLTQQQGGGFSLSLSDGASEEYDASGKLLTRTDSNGNQTTFAYIEGKLNQVTNHYGESITFTYSDDLISKAVDALGYEYLYEYDARKNLISVTYPDNTPSNSSDNPKRVYHYENLDFPSNLTGVTDENGERYSTFTYDSDGKAMSTEHSPTTNPAGQEKIELDYQGAN